MAVILVADDNEPLRTVMSKLLTSLGHTVLQASTGVEAELAFTGNNIDLLITDLIMPDRDGIELIQSIKASWPDLPIIAMSGGGRTQNFSFLDMTAQIGANTILRKPFLKKDLLSAVESLLQAGLPSDPRSD